MVRWHHISTNEYRALLVKLPSVLMDWRSMRGTLARRVPLLIKLTLWHERDVRCFYLYSYHSCQDYWYIRHLNGCSFNSSFLLLSVTFDLNEPWYVPLVLWYMFVETFPGYISCVKVLRLKQLLSIPLLIGLWVSRILSHFCNDPNTTLCCCKNETSRPPWISVGRLGTRSIQCDTCSLPPSLQIQTQLLVCYTRHTHQEFQII